MFCPCLVADHQVHLCKRLCDPAREIIIAYRQVAVPGTFAPCKTFIWQPMLELGGSPPAQAAELQFSCKTRVDTSLISGPAGSSMA